MKAVATSGPGDFDTALRADVDTHGDNQDDWRYCDVLYIGLIMHWH